MARAIDLILGDVAYGEGMPAQLDPVNGGQFGWSTEPGEWLSSQAHVPRNLIPLVIELPRFFSLMKSPEKWASTYRAFWEKHVRTIEGLKAGLTVDVGEHLFGGGGRVFQEYLDVKRDRSSLTTGVVDKYGNVFQNFFEKYIQYGMMHPETKTPLTATLAGEGPSDQLADWYGATIAFIQPDASGKKVLRTWLGANIWPHGTGPIDGKMDKTTALSITDLSLEWSVLDFVDDGTRALGQELLNGIRLTHANPQLRASFIKEISSDVAAIAKGYKQGVEDIGKNLVRPQ